jgi:hypothetical protein
MGTLALEVEPLPHAGPVDVQAVSLLVDRLTDGACAEGPHGMKQEYDWSKQLRRLPVVTAQRARLVIKEVPRELCSNPGGIRSAVK